MRRMPDPMTGFYEGPPRAERVEVITSVQRRRRWSTEEKVQIVEETYLRGGGGGGGGGGGPALHLASADGARRAHGWRALASRRCLPLSCAPLTSRSASCSRLLGKKTLENEILREAV